MKNEAYSTISIKLIPRSPNNEFCEILKNGVIKIRVTSPPVDGKANQALIDFLASKLGLRKGDVEIVSGQTSHLKLVKVWGINEIDLRKIIKNEIG